MRGKILKVTIAIVILGAACLTVYRVFFLRMIRVPTGSMANTIVPGDCLVVNRFVATVERGDLIIFRWPKDPSTQFVSRVIGLPGETIEIRELIVYINGKELPEQRVIAKPESDRDGGVLREVSSQGTGPYRAYYYARDGGGPRIPSDLESTFGISAPFKIPEKQYFVMGDNRDNSYDSRFWGTVALGAIVGKPNMIYWSSNRDESGNETVRWDRIFAKVR